MRLKNISVMFPEEAFSQWLDPQKTKPNPFWDDIELTRLLGIKAPYHEDGNFIFTGLTDQRRLSPEKMISIVGGVPQIFGKPAEIYNYPCWLKLPDTALDQDIPEEVGQTGKWSEARMARTVDGVTYVPCTNGGDYWDGTTIVAVSMAIGADIVLAPPAIPELEVPEGE